MFTRLDLSVTFGLPKHVQLKQYKEKENTHTNTHTHTHSLSLSLSLSYYEKAEGHNANKLYLGFPD